MTLDIPPPKCFQNSLITRDKILMGPGPSNAPIRVLNAMRRQVMGHLHPETCAIMDEVKAGCQYVFQTRNPVTLCISGSGHSGMEAALCNLLEPNDRVLIGVTGLWGHRAADMARRYGAQVELLEVERFGVALTLKEIETALKNNNPKVLFLTQGDSSTGVLQPLEGVGDLCERYNCLLIVDTVASLGGTPFYADKWKVDVAYTGSQKVLGAPPGITPITFSNRAMRKIYQRKTVISVYYWDVNLLGDYWYCFGRPRIYHHTISATLLYGLREALAMACEEGLPAMIERHAKSSRRLLTKLQQFGLELYVKEPEYRLPTVNAVMVPQGIDWTSVSLFAMKQFSVEISGGLGPTTGKVFRIGLMGENATDDRVDLVLKVLKDGLDHVRHKL